LGQVIVFKKGKKKSCGDRFNAYPIKGKRLYITTCMSAY